MISPELEGGIGKKIHDDLPGAFFALRVPNRSNKWFHTMVYTYIMYDVYIYIHLEVQSQLVLNGWNWFKV